MTDTRLVLACDPEFHADVCVVADAMVKSDTFANSRGFQTMDEAIVEVLYILIEMYLTDEDTGYNYLQDWLTEAEEVLEIESALSSLIMLGECSERDYPDFAESLDILQDHFEFSVTTPEYLPLKDMRFSNRGHYLTMTIMGRV